MMYETQRSLKYNQSYSSLHHTGARETAGKLTQCMENMVSFDTSIQGLPHTWIVLEFLYNLQDVV